MTDLHAHFDALFSGDADPWKYRSTWAERRRLDLLLAMLPMERYECVFEPACATGTLTERLATRARRIVAWDGSPHAIGHAERVGIPSPNVEYAVQTVPESWPDMPCDLVVLSDFLYYLPAEMVRTVAALAERTIGRGGSIIGCHWRGSAHDFRLPGGDAVHTVLADILGRPDASYRDDLHVIEVWTR